jgi:hypothetical protein
MANLLPNLEIFLSEMRKQPQVAEVKEESGLILIKLKSSISENSPFTRLVEDLAKGLNLERYVKANCQEAESDPIQEFTEKMQPFCVGEPQLKDKETILILRPEVVLDYSKFAEIRLEARKLGATLITYPRAGLSIPNRVVQAEKIDCVTDSFIVDLTALHADRLRDFLHKDISKADVAESIQYLIGHGWIEEKLCGLGFSHTTLYRFRKYQNGSER